MHTYTWAQTQNYRSVGLNCLIKGRSNLCGDLIVANERFSTKHTQTSITHCLYFKQARDECENRLEKGNI